MPKTKISGKQVLDEVKGPILIVAGMIGANMAGKAIDKVLKVESSLEGMNVKSMAKPVVLLTAGVAGAIFLKEPNLKLIATGIAASGIASSVKVFLKKDLLAGFDGLGESDLIQIEPYDPELPELEDGSYDTLDVEIAGPDTMLDDYEEIQEVEIL